MSRILIVGAHPDDAEYHAGGTAALWRLRGDRVRFIAFTNGNAGHQTLQKGELAALRRSEAARAAAVIGAEHEVLDHDDGLLEPTVELRQEMIRRIRAFAPDVVLTHRPADYHPDHRYTSLLVQDSAFLVTVPKICPDVPHLERNPVIAYFHDDFQKPCPFVPDVAVDVDPAMDAKWDMLHAHASQFYEWVPFNEGRSADVPSGEGERRRWLAASLGGRFESVAAKCRALLRETYGADRGDRVRHAEAFEVSEYGARPSRENLLALFPVCSPST